MRAETKARNLATRERERQTRINSDYELLRPGDLADKKEDYKAPNYDREKKQEYNQAMGDLASFAREAVQDPSKLAEFASMGAEQERRWLNKRGARSLSIGVFRDMLFARRFEQIAERIKWPVLSAPKFPKAEQVQRMLTLPLSDLHIGAKLPDYENPVPFDFLTAGRRLASVIYNTCDIKPQYRNHTSLNLGLNGDVIEGLLGHNDADNAALEEQMVACAQFFFSIVGYAAMHFPRVDVWCEPGNHGRNKITHPGRATSSKWNSFERAIYQFVARQCRQYTNVVFHIPRAPALVIPLFDHNALMTHGDTELALKNPAKDISSWNAALNRVNISRGAEPHAPLEYGAPIHVLIAGHFHSPQLFPLDRGWGIAQGALVPDNGFSRSLGCKTVTGMWVFESVPGFPVGDARFLRVGQVQDEDPKWDQIVPPYHWDEFEN